MKQSFSISGRLPGYNELHGAKCWQASQRVKQEAMNRVIAAARWARLQPVSGPVLLEIKCFEPNARRDQDNVEAGAKKVILDALQQMGVLRGDGRRYIQDILCPRPEVDRQKPRIEITLQEVEE